MNHIPVDFLNDKFTLVIPTYNRYSFLLRLLGFYSSYGFPFKIIILDSSSDLLENDELILKLNHKQICYQKYDSNIFITNKIARSLHLINTPYVALCADDDFLIPGGIIPCIEFLNENADYCSAHGLYITHSVIQNNDGNQFNWMCQYIGKTGSEDSNSFKRTEQYLAGKSVLPFYAIHRNRDFVSIWNDTNEYISDWGLCEIFPCSLSLIKGKMKILSVFYSSREPNDSFWYDESRLQNIYSNDKCAKCINGLAINLQKQNNISLQIAILKIKKIIEQYIEYNFLNSTGHKYVNFLQISSIFKIISRKLIRRRNIKIRQYYKHVFANSDSQYYSDFLKLEQAVISANLDFSELNHARSTY